MSSPEQMAAAAQLAQDCINLAAGTGNACYAVANRTALHGFAAMVIARTSQSVASSTKLAQDGLIGDAMWCGRTVVEFAIDFAYIALDPLPRIERFQAHDDVHHHRMATGVANAGGIVAPDIMADLERRRAAFRANNRGALSTWSGEQVEVRATAGERLTLFELSYRDQSNAGHSGPGALDYVLVQVDGEYRVRFGALEPQVHPIFLAVTGMCVLIADVVTACGLDEGLGRRSQGITDRVRTIFDNERPAG